MKPGCRRRRVIDLFLQCDFLRLHLLDLGFETGRAKTIGNGLIEAVETTCQVYKLALLVSDAVFENALLLVDLLMERSDTWKEKLPRAIDWLYPVLSGAAHFGPEAILQQTYFYRPREAPRIEDCFWEPCGRY